MNLYDLSFLGLIQVSGLDAEKFLQGQLTCDVREANETQYCLSAHCEPKGRIQAIFRLFKHKEQYYFLLPKNLISHLLQCLQKYAVFSKVRLENVSDKMPDLKSHFIVMSHPEILQQFTQKNKLLDNNTWQLLEITSGVAIITPETIGKFTPHQLNLHLIQGVSFNKGCYTGQEIIARMHYLGKLKQQMYRVSFISKSMPIPGSKLYNNDEQEVGTLVVTAQLNDQSYQALAVIQNSAIKEKIYLAKSPNAILAIMDLPYTA